MKIAYIVLGFLTCIYLAGCGSTDTTTIDSNSMFNPSILKLNYSILQGDLPSGKLTITTDSENGKVTGAYSVTTSSGSMVSVGSVSGNNTRLTLSSYDTGCIMTLIPRNTTIDSADISIISQSCQMENISETTVRLNRAVKTASLSATLSTFGSKEVISIDTMSADNINFLGALSLRNNTNVAKPIISTATFTGSYTNTAGFPRSNAGVIVRQISAGDGGFSFVINNVSGHFFSADDNLILYEGVARIAPETVIVGDPSTATGRYKLTDVHLTLSYTDLTSTSQVRTLGSDSSSGDYTLQMATFYSPLQN